MVRPMDRTCDTCGEWFTVSAGSLRKSCRDVECRQRRLALMEEAKASAVRALKRRITEVELIEATVRQARPEIAIVAARVGQISECPSHTELAHVVRSAVRPAGAVALRDALLNVAAVCVRWACALPRSNVLEPAHDTAAHLQEVA